MKINLVLILSLISSIVFSQEKKSIKSGVIILTNDAKKEFVDLTYKENMVVYTNANTQKKEHLFLSFVKKIEEKDTNYKPITTSKAHKLDTLYKPRYPEGIYLTKEDFINKTPSKTQSIVPKNIYGQKKPIRDSIAHNCFFYDLVTDKKIKKTFAVSYQGHLYFQMYSILKNRNKTDRAQTTNFHNSFVRVIDGGDNYFYTEAELTNQWAQGFAYGGVGGVAGSILAENMVYGKGVVWDFKNQEFNIFKNCKDYNKFVETVYPEGKQKCEKQQPDVLLIRQAFKKFK